MGAGRSNGTHSILLFFAAGRGCSADRFLVGDRTHYTSCHPLLPDQLTHGAFFLETGTERSEPGALHNEMQAATGLVHPMQGDCRLVRCVPSLAFFRFTKFLTAVKDA